MTLGLALSEGTLRLNDVKGTVAGASVDGRLAIETQQQPIRFDGDLELGLVDLTAVVGTAIGVPATGSGDAPDRLWRAEPFQQAVQWRQRSSRGESGARRAHAEARRPRCPGPGFTSARHSLHCR